MSQHRSEFVAAKQRFAPPSAHSRAPLAGVAPVGVGGATAAPVTGATSVPTIAPLLSNMLAHEQDASRPVAEMLQALIDAGLDRLPLPGHGATLERWRALSVVAGHDLALAKLYEGHTDALAILAELDGPTSKPGAAWGVWCAEPPGQPMTLRRTGDGRYRLSGRKSWCSGAAAVSHALVSCRDADGQPCLAAVEMRQPSPRVQVTEQGWEAVGMARSASVDVLFDDAEAVPVGAPGSYLSRPGFWHGGAGVAACWYGGARAIGDHLLKATRRQATAGTGNAPIDPHRLAHVGAIDIALSPAAALLRATAAAIDAAPRADAALLAMRARLAVEAAAETVLHHAGRALGAGPLCRDARFARLAADLPVFLRQSHAERDLATLGRLLSKSEEAPWAI